MDPGDGVRGLNAALSLSSAASITRCWNTNATVSGRLALADSAAYEDMRGTPLAGRVVRIDRKLATSTTWTIGVFTATAGDAAANNWSRSLSTTSAGTYNYRATFPTTAADPAVNSSNQVSWTIQWSTIGCPT